MVSGSYRVKTCPYCQTEFKPKKFAQVCCHNYKCALEHVRSKRQRAVEAAKRKSNRGARVKLKTCSQWLREAQSAFNAYIRYRDKSDGCISCGRNHSGQYHAGHYRSIGACPELRFCEDNVHKQCAPCNNHLSGNAIDYRIRLADKLGMERVEWLEGKNEPKKYTIEDAKEIKKLYKQKLKLLKSEE